jgi:hypothetical protein
MEQAERMAALSEVAAWAKDAREEDNKRYFYHFSDVSLIEKGTKNYVIGRKGTGKTAIAEYIKLKENRYNYTRLLSFKNFPFNILYELKDQSYTAPNQYITVWEYVIYTSICNMMSRNERIDYDSREKLRKIFDFDIEKALPSSIKRLTDRSFGLNIFGLAANLGGAQSDTENPASVSSRKDIVEKFVINNLDNSSYYILFDALDEDYKDILQPDRKQIYFDLLVGLFKALQNVRYALKSAGKTSVVPVIFLRDEIFDLCRDPDKNKWLDRAIYLDWTPARLQNLIAFRLSRAISPDKDPEPFNIIWPKFFKSISYRGRRSRKSEDIFKFMLRSTFNRPRDIINFVRECATIAINLGESVINNEIIADADAQQSDYMRREIVDETYSVVEDISEILDIIVEMGKPIFTIKEFISEYEIYTSKINREFSLDGEMLLKTLYHFSVIGNITSGNNQLFAYNSHAKRLNINANVCIHRGLLKSLELK